MDNLFNIKEHISSQNYKNMCNGLMKYHKRLCKEIKDRKFDLKNKIITPYSFREYELDTEIHKIQYLEYRLL